MKYFEAKKTKKKNRIIIEKKLNLNYSILIVEYKNTDV